MTLTGTATDSSRGNSNITGAEYFIGGDPGAGNGVVMCAADGSFDSPTEGLLAIVPTTGWAPPQMKINVRARDAAGNWSTAQEIFIPVRSSTPPGAIINLSVESETTYTLSVHISHHRFRGIPQPRQGQPHRRQLRYLLPDRRHPGCLPGRDKGGPRRPEARRRAGDGELEDRQVVPRRSHDRSEPE